MSISFHFISFLFLPLLLLSAGRLLGPLLAFIIPVSFSSSLNLSVALVGGQSMNMRDVLMAGLGGLGPFGNPDLICITMMK